jgi:hypothetical protein
VCGVSTVGCWPGFVLGFIRSFVVGVAVADAAWSLVSWPSLQLFRSRALVAVVVAALVASVCRSSLCCSSGLISNCGGSRLLL